MKPGHIYERVDATPLLNGELIFEIRSKNFRVLIYKERPIEISVIKIYIFL